MAQTSNTSFDEMSSDPSKAVDFAVVIAGWPTIYTVGDASYAIPATGDLSTASGFTAIRKWAFTPTGAAMKCKGRPEEGGVTIGEIEVEILDVNETGARALSDLLSRQAYVEGTSSGFTTTLNGTITAAATTLVLTDGTNFAAGSTIWIGQEAILLGIKTGNTYDSCTRGYLLTTATRHLSLVKVYSFKPAIFRSKAFVYKGYRGLALGSWLRAAGGILTKEDKTPGRVGFSVMGTNWEMHGASGDRRVGQIAASVNADGTVQIYRPYGSSGSHHLMNDYAQVGFYTIADAGSFADGHYLIKVAGIWLGIMSVTSDTDASATYGTGMRLFVCEVVKSLGGSPPPTDIANGNTVEIAWTSADFTTPPPTGSEPINLLLELLTSTGTGTNGAYDLHPTGVGLGIPVGLINLTTFTDIQAQYDYDSNQRVFFAFDEPPEAKKFIEEELCKPFGWYLSVGNDGRIRLVRPKHPQKFYVSRANDEISFKVASGGTSYTGTLTAGVYTAQEMATEIARAMNAILGGSTFSCTYDTSTWKFSIVKTGTTWDQIASPDDGWDALGFTGTAVGIAANASHTAPTARGAFTETATNVLTKNDVWDVQQMDTRGMQCSQVILEANYSFHSKTFMFQQLYADAETTNLGDVQGPQKYIVKSKGLIGRGNTTSANRFDPWSYFTYNAGDPCDPTRAGPASDYQMDATQSWAQCTYKHILDRYKFPPLAFKAKLKWKFNTLEQGDVVKFTYDIDGVFADRERNTTTLTSRLFEITSIKPNFRGGYVEASFLSHRYVSY